MIEMKAELEHIQKAIEKVKNITESNEISVLRFRVMPGSLATVEAANANMRAQSDFTVLSEDIGDFEVVAPVFINFVMKCKANEIFIKTDLDKVEVKCGRAKASFVRIKNAIPIERVDVGPTHLVLTSEEGLRFFSKFDSIIQTNDPRFYANCALFDFGKGMLKAVSCDNVALAVSEKINPNSEESMGQFLIASKTMKEIKRIFSLCKNSAFNFSFDVLNNEFVMWNVGYSLKAKCLAGKFPPYEDVIGQPSNVKISLKKEDILESIDRIKAFATSDHDVIEMTFDEKCLIMVLKVPGGSDGIETVETNHDNSFSKFVVKYKTKSLESLIKMCSETITLSWGDIDRPMVIESEDVMTSYVLTPVRV